MTAPHLLHFGISHYNEKVRWALDYKRWPHTRQALIPGFHIPIVRWQTGQNQVPALRLDGRYLLGSNHILEELERRRPDPALFPADPALRQRALDLQAYFDEQVAPEWRRLFWSAYIKNPALAARMATHGFGDGWRVLWRAAMPLMLPLFRGNLGLDAPTLARARQRVGEHFTRLETEIGSSGYLVGDRFSVADLTAAAIFTAIVRPPQFPYPLPEPWPDELRELRDSVSHRAGFKWVLDIYAQHRSPSAEIR